MLLQRFIMRIKRRIIHIKMLNFKAKNLRFRTDPVTEVRVQIMLQQPTKLLRIHAPVPGVLH